MTKDLTKKSASRKIALPVQVALLDVLVSERLRELRPDVVDEIASSFKTIGQLQPILVRPVKPSKVTGAHFVLVAGAHRLEAARKLKWKTIAGIMIVGVDAELAEIDENLVRADLSPAERKVHVGRRKELYEAAHPETKHGAVGRKGKSSNSEISFVDDTAHKTGRGRSTIARDAKHAATVAVLPEIAGTSLDSDSEIEALSKLPVQKQRDLAERAKAGIEVTAKPAPPAHATPSDIHDEIDTSSPASTADLSLLLQWLLLALNSPRTNAVTAVAAVGSVNVRAIIDRLRDALDEHTGDATVKSAADRAEAKSTALPPAADELPDIPPFLDRRSKPQTSEELDEDAAVIAAKAEKSNG